MGIVNNFATFTAKYHLAYLHLKIEENSRYHIPVEYRNDDDQPCPGLVDMNVDTHFPFDPYILNGSLHWIEPLFRVYEAAESDDDHDTERESPSKEEEDDFLMTACTSTSPTGNSTAIELFSYSTSPPFFKKNR